MFCNRLYHLLDILFAFIRLLIVQPIVLFGIDKNYFIGFINFWQTEKIKLSLSSFSIAFTEKITIKFRCSNGQENSKIPRNLP